MSEKAPRIDRLAFALLLPSLAVPIAAMGLAAWRMGNADDGYAIVHIGVAPNYFAAMIALAATLFSMTLNSVLLLRHHAFLPARAIRWSRTAPHYFVTLIVAVWAVYFSLARMTTEGVPFAIVLIVGSILSCVRATTGPRSIRQPFNEIALKPRLRALLIGHPILVLACVATSIGAISFQSEAAYFSLGLLALLGLPFSGATVLLWAPLVIFFWRFGGEIGVGYEFLLLAGAPAIYNSVVALRLLGSAVRRRNFVNEAFELV